MELIFLLIALAFDRIDQSRTSKRILSSITTALCVSWGFGGLIALVAAVFLVHTLVAKLSWLLDDIFSTVILVMCLGLGELVAGIDTYLEMRSRGAETEASHIASILLGREICSNGVRLAREMLAGVLVEGHTRGMAILFWYGVMGPAGALFAVFARRLALPSCATGNTIAFIGHLSWGIDWLPARLSALFYGLAGSLMHAVANWRARAWNFDSPNTIVLVASGTGALLLETESSGDTLDKATAEAQDAVIKNALALVMRALAIWIMVVALLTLGGWLN